jgi:hypothetical protein
MKAFSAFALALALAGTSFAADEEILHEYGAITIKKVVVKKQVNGQEADVERIVAVIDDNSHETPVISEDIQVDSVYYNRVFKQKVPSTLMLPFSVPTWVLSQPRLSAYEFVQIEKYSDSFQIEVRSIYSSEIKANTPYIIMNDNEDTPISFNMDDVMENGHSTKVTLNTTTEGQDAVFSANGYDWTVVGTYQPLVFKNPKGIYGFAAEEREDTKIGDFRKAACIDNKCASINPFRAFLKCTLTKDPSQVKGLAKTAEAEVASLDNLPETIAVHVISDSTGGTTYIGTLNTRTGEFVKDDNRWSDMKGRLLQHKPTTKGVYFHNKKKVVIK